MKRMTTPAKYIPDDREWEKKDRLYELYWGEMLSSREIADEFGVGSATIKRELERHGIPRRATSYTRDNTVSPFAGFYSGNDNATVDDESTTVYEENYESEVTLNWEKFAEAEEEQTEDGKAQYPV